MAELLNLRQARKRKARAEKEKQAEQNRRRHGQTKSDKMAVRAERERSARLLDGHRLEGGIRTETGPGTTHPSGK